MHPKLILTLSGEGFRDIELDQEVTTIGRKVGNDVHLDNLAVSGSHARISQLPEGLFLEDLESTNGTYVNGDRISKQLLRHGDKITIGKYEFLYQDETAATASYDKDISDKSAVFNPYAQDKGSESITAKPEQVAPAVKPAGVSEGIRAALQLLSGANVGKRLTLSKPLTRLGKPGEQVAAIQMRPNGCYVFNIPGSGGAPSLNGEVIGDKAIILKDGDILEVSNIRMKYIQPKAGIGR